MQSDLSQVKRMHTYSDTLFKTGISSALRIAETAARGNTMNVSRQDRVVQR